MRIGIEAQRILRKNKHGMDMVALHLIQALQESAPENEYVVFVRNGDDQEVLKSLSNVQVEFVFGLTYADWEQVWLPLAILRSKVEVMHFTSNTASVFCPVPFVLTLHDVIFMEKTIRSKAWYQRLGAIYRSWNVPIAVRKAANVVTVSNYELDRILQFFPDTKNKLSVIYNAVSSAFFVGTTTQDPDFETLPTKFFLFLGNTDPKKNTDNVVKGYVHYRNTLKGELPLIIGDCPREQVEKLMIAENAAYLMDDVISLGYIDHKKLAVLYRRATAFLYPSIRESFGIPIIEAMASGCVVITSTTSSMPEVSGSAAFLVDPLKPQEIGIALHKMENDIDARKQLIRAGIKRALEFSWTYSATQYTRIYESATVRNLTNKLLIKYL